MITIWKYQYTIHCVNIYDDDYHKLLNYLSTTHYLHYVNILKQVTIYADKYYYLKITYIYFASKKKMVGSYLYCGY